MAGTMAWASNASSGTMEPAPFEQPQDLVVVLRSLLGYRDYAARGRYRVVPGTW